MRVYLDTCCLNRPFDDQSQPRVRRESEAVLAILGMVMGGQVQWVASTALQMEIQAVRDPERRNRLNAMIEWATEMVAISERIEIRGSQIGRLGLAPLDALHLACSEAAGVDVFLSTDDRLVKRAQRYSAELKVAVANPLTWYRGQNV